MVLLFLINFFLGGCIPFEYFMLIFSKKGLEAVVTLPKLIHTTSRHLAEFDFYLFPQFQPLYTANILKLIYSPEKKFLSTFLFTRVCYVEAG